MANELDLLFNKLKLITPEMSDNEEPDSNAITRVCNYLAISAISSYFDIGEVKRPMLGYGLPANIYQPDEAEEYYAALRFFKKNETFFNAKNSKMIIKIMELFAWYTDKDFKEIFTSYFTRKLTNSEMLNSKDLDLRKIAKLFAKDGDLSKGLKDKEDVEKIDKQMAYLFQALRYDIINSYKNSHLKNKSSLFKNNES